MLPLARANEDAFVEVGFRVAAVALLSLVGALVIGWEPLLPASLVMLGGLYGTQLAVDDAPLDGLAVLLAAGFVVTAELGYWSLDEREAVKAEPGADLRRIAFVSALALLALLVAVLLLAIVEGVRAGGLAVDLLGAVAAGAVLLLVVVIARRAGHREEASAD